MTGKAHLFQMSIVLNMKVKESKATTNVENRGLLVQNYVVLCPSPLIKQMSEIFISKIYSAISVPAVRLSCVSWWGIQETRNFIVYSKSQSKTGVGFICNLAGMLRSIKSLQTAM